MDKFEITKETIYELIDKLKSSGLSEISLKDGDKEIKIKKEGIPITQSNNAIMAPCENISNDVPVDNGKIITAPIIGTFYSAPSPEKPNFIEAGSQIKTGDVLFIIESMKLMNEIKSECDGEVEQILLKSGDSVEFGQPVIKLK